MGVEAVNHDLRRAPTNHYPNLEYDIASGKIHHDMDPTENYILCEFKFPTIAKQMPSVDYDLIANTVGYECMHRVKYLRVSNKEFNKFLNEEGDYDLDRQSKRSNGETSHRYYSYRERKGIDVVRSKRTDTVYTHYNSNTRVNGALRHDYYMALLLYTNWPARNFVRRTPCKRFHPLCTDCPDVMKQKVNGWIDDAEPFKPTVDDPFFSFVGENHRLCIAYTVETVIGEVCPDSVSEPEYYIMDLSVQYFQEAIFNKQSWFDSIVFNRMRNNEEMYAWDMGTKNIVDKILPSYHDAWTSYKSDLPLVVYNPTQVETVPKKIWEAFSAYDLEMLWDIDIYGYNARNSAHKYTFSSWWREGVYFPDGWFCGQSTSETISSETAQFEASGDQVAEQLSQVANMFGWNDGEGGSTDSIFKLIRPKLPGHIYIDVVEPLPVRDTL